MIKFRFLIFPLILLVATVAGAFQGTASAVGNSNVYFQPNGLTVVGSTYSVQVRVNTDGSTADAVEADFTYPTSILSYTSYDLTGSPFGVFASVTGGSGSVSIQLGDTPPYVTGDVLVATVTFNVVGQGSSNLTFQNSSQLLNSGVDFLANKTNLAINAVIPIYRLANWITHERLFTVSAAERDNAVAHIPGWVSEGVAFKAATSTTPGSFPVYRLANWITHERLFTVSPAERDNAVAHIPGWVSEGTSFYAMPSGTSGAVPVFRLANWITHERLFTVSPAERDNAVAHIPGWVSEGVAFYIYP
jgi:hypothetical protein